MINEVMINEQLNHYTPHEYSGRHYLEGGNRMMSPQKHREQRCTEKKRSKEKGVRAIKIWLGIEGGGKVNFIVFYAESAYNYFHAK